jgi:hypothetical protein
MLKAGIQLRILFFTSDPSVAPPLGGARRFSLLTGFVSLCFRPRQQKNYRKILACCSAESGLPRLAPHGVFAPRFLQFHLP